jgi:hypothetical protein
MRSDFSFTEFLSRFAGNESDTAGNAISYAEFYSRSQDALLRVYDEAGNVIETHEHASKLISSCSFTVGFIVLIICVLNHQRSQILRHRLECSEVLTAGCAIDVAVGFVGALIAAFLNLILR